MPLRNFVLTDYQATLVKQLVASYCFMVMNMRFPIRR